jgi:hypothetical protein
VRDPGEEPREAGPAPPASPATDGVEPVELGGGVPVGLLALAGLDDGGDQGLVVVDDGLAEGEQDALARQSRQGRRPGLLGGRRRFLRGFEGGDRHWLVGLVQDLLV